MGENDFRACEEKWTPDGRSPISVARLSEGKMGMDAHFATLSSVPPSFTNRFIHFIKRNNYLLSGTFTLLLDKSDLFTLMYEIEKIETLREIETLRVLCKLNP